MRYQAPATRRTTARRTDENAITSVVKTAKSGGMGHLPPAQKAVAKPVKGTKRPATEEKGWSSCDIPPLTAVRQPLGVRGGNAQRTVLPPVQKIVEEVMDIDPEPIEEDSEDEDDDDWLRMSEEETERCVQELQHVQATFHDEIDMFDTTMVAEYADDIFAHMEQLEEATMPHPRYMDFQTEIEW